MTEMGDSVNRLETLIKETGQFEKLCMVDIERAEEVISTGQHLILVRLITKPLSFSQHFLAGEKLLPLRVH